MKNPQIDEHLDKQERNIFIRSEALIDNRNLAREKYTLLFSINFSGLEYCYPRLDMGIITLRKM